MFEFLSLFARPLLPREEKAQDFRKLETVRGTYFVEWRPAAVKALIAAEGLGAADFARDRPMEIHRLARDLLLLGLQDELESGRRSPIARLARSLVHRRSGGAPAPSPAISAA